MSKSLKLNNNQYWDDTGIVHEHTLLSTIINTLSTKSTIETFESTDGRYTKFSDGTMIQTKRVYVDFSFNLWYGDIAYADFSMGNWIVPFKSSNMIILIGDSAKLSGNNQAWMCNQPENISSSSAGTLRMCRVYDVGGQPSHRWTGYIYRTCIGFWK